MKYILKYGIIQALLITALDIIQYLYPTFIKASNFYWIEIVIFILPAVFAVKAFKTNNNGFIKLGKAVQIGLGVFLITAIAVFIWSVFHRFYLEADRYSIDSFEEKLILNIPEITPKEIENEVTKDNLGTSHPIIIFLYAFFLNMIIGACISLIIGAIMSKKKEL